MTLVLDTHAWIWSVEGDARRIGARSRRLLARAESAGALWVCAISLFEIAALHTSGRLSFTRPVEQWIREAIDHTGARVAELAPAVAIDAGLIPREALADPVDRVLVATARQMEATLLTADARVLDYAKKVSGVRVYDASR
jgi:PIN domain nuclease of toxin-antitoxin system